MCFGNPGEKKPSPVIFFTVFLIIVFIAPVCHSHGNPTLHPHAHGDDHDRDLKNHDNDIHESVSDQHAPVDPHLHIKKDFLRSNALYELRNKLEKISTYCIENFRLTFENVFKSFVDHFQELKSRSSLVRVFSGLSPPVC
ncbi:MAG: hypothetical protein M1508_06870 [Nitrospirae bacterium]|nr:hypothetical protein [Nitrospirota bacterium]